MLVAGEDECGNPADDQWVTRTGALRANRDCEATGGGGDDDGSVIDNLPEGYECHIAYINLWRSDDGGPWYVWWQGYGIECDEA